MTSQQILTIAGEALVGEEGKDMTEYHQIKNTEYDRELCLVRSEVIAFLKDTQPEEYRKLVVAKSNEQDAEKALFFF